MECGTARVEITPPCEIVLFGYPLPDRRYEPPLDKILDPLQARCLYFQSGPAPGILLITLDLCLLLPDDAMAFRMELASALRLPLEHILIACTHTHSAPMARITRGPPPSPGMEAFYNGDDEASLHYGQWLLERLSKTAALAISRRSSVNGLYRRTFTGLGYDRRCVSGEEVVNCWNIAEFPERSPEAMKALPHTVINLAYQNKQGGILIDNVGIHPVVMGKQNSAISGDWPSYSRRHIEKRLKGYQAVFTMGAGAQVQPWLSTQGDPRALRLVGEAIGAESVLLAHTADRIYLPEGPLKMNESRLAGSRAVLSVMELGQLLIVGVPFELSANWARTIEEELSRPVVFITLCNGWHGYWMAPHEFVQGGYEIEIAISLGISPDDSRALLRQLKAHSS